MLKNYFYFINSVIVLTVVLIVVRGDVYAQKIKKHQTTDPRKNSEYVLIMSEAYNYLEKKDYVKAGSLVNNYLDFGKNYADAHLIMGEIFFEKKFYQQAEENFNEAEKSKKYFIFPEQVVRLYWDQVYNLNHSKVIQLGEIVPTSKETITFDMVSDIPAADKKIYEILINLISYVGNRQGSYYQTHLGKAYFILGRLLYKTSPLKAMENFLKAAKNGFLVKSAYLYLAFFFAVQEQEVINDIYRSGNKGLPPPKKRNAFLSYYQNYQDASNPNNNLLQKIIPKKEYETMKYTIKNYYQKLHR